MRRAERQLARVVIREAAKAAGMRRLNFMRAVNSGDPEACDELKISLVAEMHGGEPTQIDVARLKEILEMILEFISRLLELFSLFA